MQSSDTNSSGDASNSDSDDEYSSAAGLAKAEGDGAGTGGGGIVRRLSSTIAAARRTSLDSEDPVSTLEPRHSGSRSGKETKEDYEGGGKEVEKSSEKTSTEGRVKDNADDEELVEIKHEEGGVD